MPAIRLDTVITDPQGNAVVMDNIDGGKLTLGRACVLALDAGLAPDQNEGLRPKLRRGRLIEKIEKADEAELSAADVTLITERVVLVFTAASVVRQIALLLDPGAEKD